MLDTPRGYEPYSKFTQVPGDMVVVFGAPHQGYGLVSKYIHTLHTKPTIL